MFQLLLAIIYLAFISLGLPDSLLGSAWPIMYREFSVPVSYAGIISMIIAAGTIVSSLQCDRLTRRLGTGKVTALSVLTTAVALFGFSVSHSFPALCIWAIPYGLGAGCVDASLNNYVALHYASRHMSWLHCMWGVGASLGPYIMGFALSNGQSWNMGYRYIGILQIVLTAVLLFSLPLWKGRGTGGQNAVEQDTGQGNRQNVGQSGRQNIADTGSEEGMDAGQNPAGTDFGEVTERRENTGSGQDKALTLRQIFRIPGAKEVMLTFFCYCAVEQTAGLWASSYLVLHWGISSETAANFASMFYIGITVGRALGGFLTLKLNDKQMIRLGQGVVLFGIALLLLPIGKGTALFGLIAVGLGCAPIYPSIIHSTPDHFGADKSQAVIGVQMAAAYVGTCIMPPIFGLIANHISIVLFPMYLLLILALMVLMHERLLKRAGGV